MKKLIFALAALIAAGAVHALVSTAAKEAGKATGDAAKHTGKAAAKETKKGVHATAKTVKKGANKVEEKSR